MPEKMTYGMLGTIGTLACTLGVVAAVAVGVEVDKTATQAAGGRADADGTSVRTGRRYRTAVGWVGGAGSATRCGR